MDISCPYCDVKQYINHDDGYGYEEGVKHEQQCDECDKHFVYTTSISYYYESEKAECLNGKEHDFKPTRTYPKEFTMMKCTMCEETRKATSDEMVSILSHTGA